MRMDSKEDGCLEDWTTDTGSCASDAETTCSSGSSSSPWATSDRFRRVSTPRLGLGNYEQTRFDSTHLEPIPGTPVAAGAKHLSCLSAACRFDSVADAEESRGDDTTDTGSSDTETSCSSVSTCDGSRLRSAHARFIRVTPQVEGGDLAPHVDNSEPGAASCFTGECSSHFESHPYGAQVALKFQFRPPQPGVSCIGASVTLESGAAAPAIEAALECARIAALPVKLHVPERLTRVIPFVAEMPVKKRLPLACHAHPSTVLATGAADAAMMRLLDQSVPVKKRVTSFLVESAATSLP